MTKHITWTTSPTCPFCNGTDDCWHEGAPENANDGSEWVHTCPHCDKEYQVTLYVEYTFDSRKIEDGDG